MMSKFAVAIAAVCVSAEEVPKIASGIEIEQVDSRVLSEAAEQLKVEENNLRNMADTKTPDKNSGMALVATTATALALML